MAKKKLFFTADILPTNRKIDVDPPPLPANLSLCRSFGSQSPPLPSLPSRNRDARRASLENIQPKFYFVIL